MRLKQFLYDWAPAAFDHPALWRSAVRPFAVGPRVGWLGTDYLGHPAASLHAHRTLVELSVLEGTVHDEVLADLCRSLVPVSASACACIDATSLADLSYARRHEDPVVTVPVGYFHHHRRSEHRLHARAPRDVPEDAPGSEVVRRLAHRMRSDAVFLVGDPEHPCEVDWVLRRPEEPDDAVRILVGAPDGPDAIAVPPSLDAQPCESEVLEVGTARVHHAWADDRFGPHEAVWREARQAVMLLARPRGQTNAAWFRALLADILEGRPSAASGVGPQPS